MPKFIIITISMVKGNIPYEEISAKIGRSKDWARYAPGCWLIWTNLTPHEWYGRIRPFITEADTLFVAELAKPWKGLLPTKVINWLKLERPDDMDGE